MFSQIRSIAKKQAYKFKVDLNHPYWERFKINYIRSRWDVSKVIGEDDFLYNFFYLGWTRPTDHSPVNTRKDFYWPLYKNARYNRELTKFMFSFRSDKSISRNINNLMFITGPESSGKSWFLNYNLDKFRSVDPLLVHYDLKEHNSFNFDTFLDTFEWMIIDEVVRKVHLFDGKPIQTVKDLLLFNNDPRYIDIAASKLITQTDLIDADKDRLLEFASTNPSVLDSLKELSMIIGSKHAVSEEQQLLYGVLELVRGIFIMEEHKQSPLAYASGLYRTGIKTAGFLLDLLNLIGGYHFMNIEQEEYPHVLVVIEHFQKLLDLETCEDRAYSWFEHICVRLYNDEGWRNHIPMLIETNKNPYFNTEVYDLLYIQENSFPTIEWLGLENTKEMPQYLSHIFNSVHCEYIEKAIGKHLHYLRIFTNSLISSPVAPDFLAMTKVPMDVWKEEYNKFLCKINSLYLGKNIGHIDFALADFIENLVRCRGQLYVMAAIGEEVKQKSIVKALMNVGIIYAEKHFSYLVPSSGVHYQFMQKLLKDFKNKMSIFQKIEYKWWRLVHGLHISDMNINYKRDEDSYWADNKQYLNWDLDIYGKKYGKRADPEREGWALITPGTKDQLLWHPSGKGKQTQFFRHLFMPFWYFGSAAINYPMGFMHLPEKYIKEGRNELAPTMNIVKNLHEKNIAPSELPQHNSEIKLGISNIEYNRGLLKLAFMDERSDMYKKNIKWRYVRRFYREINK